MPLAAVSSAFNHIDQDDFFSLAPLLWHLQHSPSGRCFLPPIKHTQPNDCRCVYVWQLGQQSIWCVPSFTQLLLAYTHFVYPIFDVFTDLFFPLFFGLYIFLYTWHTFLRNWAPTADVGCNLVEVFYWNRMVIDSCDVVIGIDHRVDHIRALINQHFEMSLLARKEKELEVHWQMSYRYAMRKSTSLVFVATVDVDWRPFFNANGLCCKTRWIRISNWLLLSSMAPCWSLINGDESLLFLELIRREIDAQISRRNLFESIEMARQSVG